MVNRSPLLRVAYCAKCEAPLNVTTATWNGKQYRYYRCPNERLKPGCDAKRINADQLESSVETMMLESYGSRQLIEVVEIAGIDYVSVTRGPELETFTRDEYFEALRMT